MMSATPEVQPPPLTITVDKELQFFNTTSQKWEYHLVPMVVLNPALECRDKTPAFINVPGSILLMFVMVVATWIICSWWHKQK